METNSLELETKIDNVIIYQSGVQLTLKGNINLESGEKLVKITNLPSSLDKESIRVKGLGNGKIINLVVEYNSRKEYKKEEHKQLQEERERIEKEIDKIDRDIMRTNEQINKFKATEDNFYDGWAKAFAFGEVDLSQFVNFDRKINEMLTNSAKKVEQLREKRKDLKLELDVVLNKMSKLGPVEKVYNFYEITINLNVMKQSDFKFEIRYTMTQAWWIPFYDVALSEDKARLTIMANVFNRTGLDWENVEIEISTASLKPIQLIKPSPMVLQEYYPYDGITATSYSRRAIGGKADKIDDLLMAGMHEREEEDFDDFILESRENLEMKQTYAEVSENIGVQSFKIPNRINIPSDENPHPINLTTLELETKKQYFWSSLAPENVVIRDSLKNGDLLLLAGNVKIYYKEEFLGETNIPIIAPKEEFKLGTRVSYDLKIDKKLVDRSKAKKAIKSKLKNNYSYKIIIKNLNNVEQTLTIYDRIPHSNSEKIKVDIEEIIPEPSKKELGILKWRLNLKGIDEKMIQYKYYIEYNKEITVTPPLP
ncbi:MAG: mucoidy inhibitor MuiA family protein [Promethearchaeota archaeon]